MELIEANHMKTKSKVSSLNAIRDADPRLVRSLMKALSEELKRSVSLQSRVVSFICPNCDAKLGVTIRSGKEAGRKVGGGIKRRRSNFASGVNKVVLQLAKLRGSMTADVHRDFTKLLGGKARKMSKEEYRERKLAWLRSEIAKSRGRRRKISAA
jgi:hypothetical protein